MRADAGQPLDWPEGAAPPLSRLALTRMALSDCAEQGVTVEFWDAPLLDPGTTEILREALAERLWLSWEDAPETPTFGALVLWMEQTLLERWRHLSAVTDPDREALDAVLSAVRHVLGRGIESDTLLEEVLSLERQGELWRALAPPWDQHRVGFRLSSSLWPPTAPTVISVALWLALGALLWVWQGTTERIRLFIWGMAGLFVFQYGIRPTYRWTDTPGTIAGDLARSWREEIANLVDLERTWFAPPT